MYVCTGFLVIKVFFTLITQYPSVFSCVHLPSTGIKGMNYCSQFVWFESKASCMLGKHPTYLSHVPSP